MRIVISCHNPNWRTRCSQGRDRFMQSVRPGCLPSKLDRHPTVNVEVGTILKIPQEDVWLFKLVLSDLNASVCGNISS
jgi:hypothetical protein